MSDALLKNTFNKISTAYELVADVTVGTATTQVDFSGLNFGKDDDLMLVSTILNTSVSGASYSLFVNENYTATNYWRQRLSAFSTTVNGARNNDGNHMYADAGTSVYSELKLKLTNNGYYVSQNEIIENVGGSSIILQNRYLTSTFTVSSISSLRIASGITNAIGIGSRFQLYRLKAKKVADIIVSSATTQVDITGLEIDKDSEYMLVSTIGDPLVTCNYSLFINDDTSDTNYYEQNISASGATVSGSRMNNSRFSGRDTLVITNLKLTNNGYFVFQSNVTQSIGSSSVLMYKYYGTSTFTVSSIAKLSIKATATNGIVIGSRFTLYKMK